MRKHKAWRKIREGDFLPSPYDAYRVVRRDGEMGDWEVALALHLREPHEPVLCPYCRAAPLDFVWNCQRRTTHGECWCHTCKLWFGPLRIATPRWMPQVLKRHAAMPAHVMLTRPWWGRLL